MKPFYQSDKATVYHGDAREFLACIPDNSVNLIITSSDYWRQLDHGHDKQVGMAPHPEQFIQSLADIFDQCLRILVEGGCLFQIMADTQNNNSPIRKVGETRRSDNARSSERRKVLKSHREKEPLDIPFQLSEELRSRGWIKRQWLIWDKISGGDMTQSDGAAVDHEWILYLHKWSKKGRPYANCSGFASSILRYMPYRDPLGIHPCPFPPGLAQEIILAASQPGDTVVDLFGGSGVSAGVALSTGRQIITGDIVEAYAQRIVMEVTGEVIMHSGVQTSLLSY